MLQLNYCNYPILSLAYNMTKKDKNMNDIKCVTECTGKCGNWDEINDPDVISWTCSDCCVMIGINKG